MSVQAEISVGLVYNYKDEKVYVVASNDPHNRIDVTTLFFAIYGGIPDKVKEEYSEVVEMARASRDRKNN